VTAPRARLALEFDTELALRNWLEHAKRHNLVDAAAQPRLRYHRQRERSTVDFVLRRAPDEPRREAIMQELVDQAQELGLGY